jgi:hypothetical protein
MTELERLTEEHRRLEARLDELNRHLSLTPEEHLERIRLKKQKLLTKDRMAQLESR